MVVEDSVCTNQPGSHFPQHWLLAELLRRQPLHTWSELSCRVVGTWTRPPGLGVPLQWHILRVKCPKPTSHFENNATSSERTAGQTSPCLRLTALQEGSFCHSKAYSPHLMHKTKCWVFAARHKMNTHSSCPCLTASDPASVPSLLPFPQVHSLCLPLSPSMAMKSHALSPSPSRCH